MYTCVYSIDSRRIYRRSRWRSTEVRISISKLLNLPRFDDTGLCNYRFVERPSVTVYWQVARLYRGFIKISEGDVPPSLSYIRIKGSCGTNHYWFRRELILIIFNELRLILIKKNIPTVSISLQILSASRLPIVRSNFASFKSRWNLRDKRGSHRRFRRKERGAVAVPLSAGRERRAPTNLRGHI